MADRPRPAGSPAQALAIVQARMSSSRLPGKVLLDIAGESMLAHVVQRLRRCPDVGRVVVATTTGAEDDAIVSACEALGVGVTRGSRDDVLDRYMAAAREFDGEPLVRVTSDCPLLDPEVCSTVIRRFRQADPAVDYASNKIPQSFPRGLDVEVFTRAALERAWREGGAAYERAHVTPYLYEHPDRFRLLSVTDTIDRSWWRWTVDTGEDLEFVRAVHQRLATPEFSWRDVVALIEREPSLLEINGHIEQKALTEG